MTKLLKKCSQCNTYTLNQEKCPTCNSSVKNAHPARFSIEDRYGSYRRKMKKNLLSSHDTEKSKETS
ncbi:MAG: RNA-protein complex protein Nop10 [Candidatus Hermodarchaeota archaeon]